MIPRTRADYSQKCLRRLGSGKGHRPWLWSRQPKSNRRLRALLKQWGIRETEVP